MYDEAYCYAALPDGRDVATPVARVFRRRLFRIPACAAIGSLALGD